MPRDLPYRWVILAVAWGALLMAFVDRLAWANLAVQVGGSLGMPIAELGIFVTAFYVGYVGSNALGGVATDWLGPSRMLVFAMFPLGVCTFLFSFTSSVALGLVLQLLMGLAAGADYSASVKLAATWFEFRLRGRAMGLLITASSVAVVLTNATVPTLSAWLGWTGTYRLLGLITVLIGALCWLVLRDAPHSSNASVKKPPVSTLVRNRDLMLLSLVGFGALWGTWGFAFWVNALLTKGYGISPIRAGFIVATFGIGGMFTKPLIGLLSDWIGGRRKTLLIICLTSFSAMLLLFGTLDSEPAFIIAAPVLGVTAFAYSPLLAAMAAETVGPALVGSATGFTSAFWQLGNVTVPLVVGTVYQSTHSFGAAFVVLAAGPLFGTIVMFSVRERHLF
jgi:predicted MFS family arabinose efflux permease